MAEAADPTTAHISVVVVNWNGHDIIRPCLDSLLAQRCDQQLEIIVVDNGSTDHSVDMLGRDYPTVRIIETGANLGFAGGANTGIDATTSDTVVLINNDAVAEPDFVSALHRTLTDNPTAGAVTGRILLAARYAPGPGPGALTAHDGTTWHVDPAGQQLINSTGNEVTRSGNGRDRDWLRPAHEHRPAGAAPGFSGGAVALRRTALDQVGPFDERYFMYYEDTELSWRLRRAGWEIRYAPDATVHHQHAASSDSHSQFFLLHNERNRLYFALTHTPRHVIATAITHTAGSAALALLRGRPRTTARKLRALTAGLRAAPSLLRQRRHIDRTAVVPRQTLAADLIAD